MRDDYIAMRDGLEKIKSEQLSELKNKLISLSEELIKFTDNTAVCIGICADNTLNEKQTAMNNISERYAKDLADLGEQISEKYNPNSLILDLGEYSNI